MATHLKASDQPQPWFSPQNVNDRTARQRRSNVSSSVVEEEITDNRAEGDRKTKQRRSAGKQKSSDGGKGMRKGKGKSTSALDAFLKIADTVVPNVDELRRKREEDAVACGRPVRKFCDPSTQRIRISEGTSERHEKFTDTVAWTSSASGFRPPAAKFSSNLAAISLCSKLFM